MLTPKEVSEYSFARASFGGYNMSMVDEFLDLVTADYTTLYNENALLKSKMKVLVDKVEEYRATEDGMRKALMTAQRMADDMVQEAQRKKTTILADAQQEVSQQVEQLRAQIRDEEYRLEAARKATADYVAQIRALHAGAQEYLDKLGTLTAPAVQPDKVDDAAQAIQDSIQRLFQEEQPPAQPDGLDTTLEFAPVEPAPPAPPAAPLVEEDEEDEDLSGATVHRIDFGNLQFGKDYEIK